MYYCIVFFLICNCRIRTVYISIPWHVQAVLLSILSNLIPDFFSVFVKTSYQGFSSISTLNYEWYYHQKSGNNYSKTLLYAVPQCAQFLLRHLFLFQLPYSVHYCGINSWCAHVFSTPYLNNIITIETVLRFKLSHTSIILHFDTNYII